MPLRHARERRLWTLARDVRCRMVPWWALCRARGAASRCRARAGRHTDRVQGGGPRQQPRAAPHVSRARPLAARKAKAIASHGTAAAAEAAMVPAFSVKIGGSPRANYGYFGPCSASGVRGPCAMRPWPWPRSGCCWRRQWCGCRAARRQVLRLPSPISHALRGLGPRTAPSRENVSVRTLKDITKI